MTLRRATTDDQDTMCQFAEKLEVEDDRTDIWSWDCKADLPTKPAHEPLHYSMPQFPSAAKIRCTPSRSLPRSPRMRTLSTVLSMDDCITTIPLDDKEETDSHPDPSTQSTLCDPPVQQYGAPPPLPPPTRPGLGRDRSHTNSLFSVLSAPSKISRSATQHYLFSPASVTSFHDHPDMLETMSFSKVRKGRPSRRGICNTMTILAVVAVILFLFAGYPLTLYITKDAPKKAQVA